MNNKRILIVGVLAVIVTMMVGYALFSENITINGTATAKGNFSVTTTCQAGLSNDAIDAMVSTGMASSSEEVEMFTQLVNKSSTNECLVNGTTVTLTSNLKYPGALSYNTITIKNTGSIDAVLFLDSDFHLSQTVKVYDNKTDSLYETYTNDDLYAYFKYAKFEEEGEGSLVYIKTPNGFINGYGDRENSDVDRYLRIKPDEEMIFIINAVWDDEATDNEHYSVNTAKLTLPFTQVTNDMSNIIN